MSQFDESKIRRDGEGKFATKGPSGEAGVSLDVRSADGGVGPDQWRDTEPGSTSPIGMESFATTEEQKSLPGALIADERPIDSAHETFTDMGHDPARVDEAFSHLVPKIRYDVDGHRYESLTDGQMDQATDMLKGDMRDHYNHDCRDCGNQMMDEASPDIDGTCNRCSGLYEMEDSAAYGLDPDDDARLGSYVRDDLVNVYGEAGGKAYDHRAELSPSVSNDFGESDRAISDAERAAMRSEALHELYGENPEVRVGSRTPWGKAQTVDNPARGVVFASTSGHGGYKLSPQRNKAIPPALREKSGWYDEDDGRAVVAMYHPDAMNRKDGATSDDVRAEAAVSLRDSRPDAYEQATGTTIPFGVSPAKDRAAYFADKQGQTLVFSAGAQEDPENPGYVKASTRVHGDPEGGFKTHLIPKDAYDSLSRSHGAAKNSIHPVLPKGSIDVTPTSSYQRPAPVTTVSSQGLSSAAQARVNKDLDRQWRDRNGQVQSMREMIEGGQINKKTAYVSGGKRTYALLSEQSESQTYSYQVTRDTFNAYDGPDDRSEADVARQDMSIAAHKNDQAQEAYKDAFFAGGSRQQADRAKAEADKANDAYKAAAAEYHRVSGS